MDCFFLRLMLAPGGVLRSLCTRDALAASGAGLAATVLVFTVSCRGGDAQPDPASPTAEQLTVRLSTGHFQLLADRADAATIQAIADALESSYPRVTADLRVDRMPVVSVYIWTDSSSFDSAMRANIGQSYPGSTGYVFPSGNIAVQVVGSVARNATHEFAHVVSLTVNPSIGNNPRWLWEAVAIYENREFVDPTTLDYLRAGRYPTLAALDSDFNAGRQVYEVGYVLGEFIVATWGLDGLVGLIRSNGNVPGTLGVSVAEFEQRWYAFLSARYGLPIASPCCEAQSAG